MAYMYRVHFVLKLEKVKLEKQKREKGKAETGKVESGNAEQTLMLLQHPVDIFMSTVIKALSLLAYIENYNIFVSRMTN